MFEAHQSYIKGYKKVNELLKLTSRGVGGGGMHLLYMYFSKYACDYIHTVK